MARIPTVESRVEITPRAPAVRRPVVAARRVGEEVIEAGKTLENIGAMYQRARDLNQYTKAGTEIDKRLLEIKGEAANTPIDFNEDFENIVKTSQEKIKKLRDDVLPKISNPEIRLKMGGAFDLSELKTLNSIKSEGRRRWEDMMEADFRGRIEAKKEIYIEEKNPVFKEIAKNDIIESINNHIELGIISKKEGLKRLTETLDVLPVLEAKNDMDRNPSGTRDALVNKEYGIKDAKIREGLIRDAGALEKRNIEEATRRLTIDKHKTEQRVATSIIDNNITSISQVDDLQRTGVVDAKFADVARSFVMSNKKINSKDLAMEYDKLIDEWDGLEMRDGETKKGLEEIARMRTSLIQAHSKGVITSATLKKRLKLLDDEYDDATEQIVTTEFKQGKEIRGFWKTLFTRGERGLGEEEQAEAMMFLDKELTNRLLEGKIPEGKVNEVAMNIFKKYLRAVAPEVLGLEEIPSGTISRETKLKSLHTEPPKTRPERQILTKPDTVVVQSPDGEIGSIPAENLDAAIEEGYVIWQK